MKGVRQCIQLGMTPDERDTDSWSPLHYACWSVCVRLLLLAVCAKYDVTV